ncbi:EAL domain-containing protein [Citrobacter braakii]|uniref:EAL domain-containing protein n=1 Tax=Citrobacter braakii TaxID=57706 RepID=UPI00351CFCBE
MPMNDSTLSSLSSVFPLDVSAFGRILLVTPVFEPIWDNKGVLVGMEMLSRLHDPNIGVPFPPDIFFKQAPIKQRFRVLRWQMNILPLIIPWCQSQSVCVSVNVSRDVANKLMADDDMILLIKSLYPWLRFEISENFLKQDIYPGDDQLLNALRKIAPLWLDDFGVGSTGLSCIINGQFDAIKLDRGLFSYLIHFQEGENFLRTLARLSHALNAKIIAEGVSDEALMHSAMGIEADLCQGWYWPSVTLERLRHLPSILPSRKIST